MHFLTFFLWYSVCNSCGYARFNSNFFFKLRSAAVFVFSLRLRSKVPVGFVKYSQIVVKKCLKKYHHNARLSKFVKCKFCNNQLLHQLILLKLEVYS